MITLAAVGVHSSSRHERRAGARRGRASQLGDDEAGLIASLIELGLDAQPRGRAGVADQVDEGFEGAERTAPPVLRDVAEEPMLDLVPFAGARREVRDVNARCRSSARRCRSTFQTRER